MTGHKPQIDPFDAHEVVHMAGVIRDMFARHVELHRFTRSNAALKRSAQAISADLGAFVQLASRTAPSRAQPVPSEPAATVPIPGPATEPARQRITDRRLDSLIRIAEVKARTGLSVATIYRREQAGAFPPRIRLGPRSVGWYESDVDDFVAAPGSYRAA